jgi:hypothetical protein
MFENFWDIETMCNKSFESIHLKIDLAGDVREKG